MAITVTLRGNNTGTVSDASSQKAFYATGILPDIESVGDVPEKLGGNLANRKGGRWVYSVSCRQFDVDDTTITGNLQDYGDYQAVVELMKLNRHLWLYSVSGASRKDAAGNDWWGSEAGLPVAVVLRGDARLAPSFATGGANFEFELASVTLTLS